MGKCRNNAAIPLQIKELVRVWQKTSSQIATTAFLLPHQQQKLFTRFTRYHQSLATQPRQLRRRLTRKARRTLTEIAFMLTVGVALPVEAATLLVNTNIPDVNPDGFCSLIEAIDNANADSAVHADCPAGSGADVIQLQSGSVHNIMAALSGLPAQGLPSISSELLIEGNGATLQVAAVPVDRVIDVAATGDLTLSEATISGDSGSGTASNSPRIHNAGTLQLSNVSLLLNPETVAGIANTDSGTLTADHVLIDAPDNPYYSVPLNGFGILNEGNITLTDSVVRNLETNYYANANHSSVINRGSMRLERSSITGNFGHYQSRAVSGIDNAGYLLGNGLKVYRNGYYCYNCDGDPAGIVKRNGATLKLMDS